MIRYLEGELPEAPRGALSAHLEKCPECQLELNLLREGTGAAPWGAAEEDGGSGRELLARVMNGVRAWDAAQEDARRRLAVRRRVMAEVAPYLGRAAAATVLGAVSEHNDDLLAAIEPVLAQFLGGRAAASLVEHIVDTAISEA